MSWDVDEKEFYETFAEIESERGIEEAKRWAWSALDWTQKELRNKESEIKRLHDEISKLREHRESCAKNLLKGYKVGKEEALASVVAWLRGNTCGCYDFAAAIERGEHLMEKE